MKDDEQAIRELVDQWLAATKAGNIATLLTLMADDVVFMVPGREPFGKEAFAASAREMKNVVSRYCGRIPTVPGLSLATRIFSPGD